MSFAFGHLVGAWCAGKIYEYFSKKKISHYTWFFLLLGGILPDADFLLDWTLGYDTHRTFTHSLFFLVAIPLLVYALFTLLKNPEKKYFAIFIGVGIFTHLFLDSFSKYGIPLLWPMLGHFSFSNGLTPVVPEGGLLQGSVETFVKRIKLTVIDMAIGTA